MLPAGHIAALRAIAAQLAAGADAWAVTGSCGLALQGLAIPVGDLDIQTDAGGAYALAAAFPDHVVRPVRLSAAERIRSHFGMLRLQGVDVEIMGDVQYRLPDGRWAEPAPCWQHLRFAQLGEIQLPVFDLTYELEAYRNLGRDAKVALITAHFQG